jgi:hypothetical protein
MVLCRGFSATQLNVSCFEPGYRLVRFTRAEPMWPTCTHRVATSRARPGLLRMRVPPIDPRARGRAPRYRLWCSWCAARLASARLRDCEARREQLARVVLNATVEFATTPLWLSPGASSAAHCRYLQTTTAPRRARSLAPDHPSTVPSILGRSTRHSRVARQWETVALRERPSPRPTSSAPWNGPRSRARATTDIADNRA